VTTIRFLQVGLILDLILCIVCLFLVSKFAVIAGLFALFAFLIWQRLDQLRRAP
jgi:hypothetical protein